MLVVVDHEQNIDILGARLRVPVEGHLFLAKSTEIETISVADALAKLHVTAEVSSSTAILVDVDVMTQKEVKIGATQVVPE